MPREMHGKKLPAQLLTTSYGGMAALRPAPGLGTYWLAATLGTSNTRFKKLSKKDLLACNVPKACQKLIEPDEPLVRSLASLVVCQTSTTMS